MADNSDFNPLHYPASLIDPERIDSSDWIGHVPFGMYLIDLLCPEAIAEVETHLGLSYCAFCQAVKECGGFSRLIKSTFDDALESFDDRRFDLLHIDGLHDYDTVKQNFEKWLPKLSERSLVLFHDINRRERECTVWKFWEEVKPAFPHFEFAHSQGLGVLAVGKNYPEPLNKLFRCSAEEATKIRSFFAALGARLEAAQELHLSRAATTELRLRTQQQLDEKDQDVRTKDSWIQELNQSIKTKDLHLREMDQSLKTMDQSLRAKDLHAQDLHQAIKTKDLHIEEMEKGILLHLQSPSYRLGRAITWPLRAVKRLFD